MCGGIFLSNQMPPKQGNQFPGQRLGLQCRPVRTNQDLATRGRHLVCGNMSHVKIQMQRAIAELRKVSTYLQTVVKPGGIMKVYFQVNPGQPHIEPVEEYAVRDSEMAKHLSFGDFEKPDIRTVIDNAGGVYVRPSDIFIDKKRFRFQAL